MAQTRKGSLVEAITNTAIGFLVAFASQMVIFPMFDIHVPLSSNIGITALFTLVSVARQFVVRRLWVRKFHG